MRIRTTKKDLTQADMQAVIRAIDKEAERKRRLRRYYLGEHAIMNKIGRANTDVNNRAVANYASYIVNMTTGFFLGKPITYKSNEDISKLLDVLKYNDEAVHNLHLAEEAAITGSAYEILYLDADAEIRFAPVPSEEIALITDATLEENILFAVRRYRIRGLDTASYQDFVDVYDADKVTHCAFDGQIKILGEYAHYFDDVPIVEYPNNIACRGDFEDVITLIDAYNKAQSLSLDDMEDFTNAYLILKGMGGTNAEDAKKMREDKIISLDEGGAAEWLIKNVNDTFVENLKTRLQKDIHKFSNVPDMTDESFAGNASGVAIAYKLIGLEQVRSRKEREFKKALQRRIELINNIFKIKDQKPIDFRAVDMQFSANIPQDIQSLASIVAQLEGLVSNKTLLGLLPFIEDVEQELKSLDDEEPFYTKGDEDNERRIDDKNVD